MGKTILTIRGEDFYINGRKTYSEIAGSRPETHGLLMNARFIQGIFDDKADPARFNRFGREFDPNKNTDDLIAALPQWYRFGLRAFTVGLQGGGPCFTIGNDTIENNPYSADGKTVDPAYLSRLERLIHAADELGMAVIVSYFYPGQLSRMKDGRSIANAVRAVSRFLRDKGFTNVIIEVCNELDINKSHPVIYNAESMALLMEMARQESGGMPVGCSGGGGSCFREVSEESDVILIHGNGCSRQRLYNLIREVREHSPGKPVVCNEDSQCVSRLEVAFQTHTSWGYYNNMTKQEPPADWSVTKGEDQYFAYRMAKGIGIDVPELPLNEQVYLQGLEAEMHYQGKRWLRLASLYPETINYVEFFRGEECVYTCYDDPFLLQYIANWLQGPVDADTAVWKAVIHFTNGDVIEKRYEIDSKG